jgi:hypothetical protein
MHQAARRSMWVSDAEATGRPDEQSERLGRRLRGVASSGPVRRGHQQRRAVDSDDAHRRAPRDRRSIRRTGRPAAVAQADAPIGVEAAERRAALA